MKKALIISSILIFLWGCESSSSPTIIEDEFSEESSNSSDLNDSGLERDNVSSSSGYLEISSSIESIVESSSEENSSSSDIFQIESSSSIEIVPVVSSSSSVLSELKAYEDSYDYIDDGWRDECLKIVNDYRATEGREPLILADDEKQLCAIKQAENDMSTGKAHGHFGDCGERAQNTGPDFSTTWRNSATLAVQYFEKKMWEDEKALVENGTRSLDSSEDYPYIGHYINMRGSYTKLACSIAISSDGKKAWFNMNFY